MLFLIVLVLYIKYFLRKPFFPKIVLKPINNVVVSLTTSPERLKHLNFSFLDLKTRIILNLPLLFRGTTKYDANDVDAIKKKNPNLIVNWIQNDLGPQTKLLGLFATGSFIKDISCNDVIVVIDDDTLYDPKILEKYASYIFNVSRPTVLSGKLETIYGHIIQPGYHSYALKAMHIDCKKFLDLNNMYAVKECKLHDDFVFSAIFKHLNFKQEKINLIEPLQLPVGFGSDALFWQQPSHIKHKKCSNLLDKMNYDSSSS